MNSKKRGFLIVVVLLFSLFQSYSVLGGWKAHCPTDQCISIVVGVETCYGGSCSEIDGISDPNPDPLKAYNFDCNEEGIECQSYEPGTPGGTILNLMDTGDCKLDVVSSTPPDNGCWLVVGDEDDSPNDDDCGYRSAVPGMKFGNGVHSRAFSGPMSALSGDVGDPEFLSNWAYANDKWEYICSDNNLWARCDSQEHLKKKVVADGKTYECTINKNTGAYEWVTDQDKDGYTTSEDCDDDASDDYPGLECPTVEGKDQTVEEIRKLAKGACEKNPGRYSSCAICINSGAAEVCGDGINNDCGGPGQSEELEDTKGVTSDSCHENKASCEQGVVGHCSESNEICSEANPCEEGEECLTSENAEQITGICRLKGQPPVDTCDSNDDCGNVNDWECDTTSSEPGTCQYIATELCTDDNSCGGGDYICDKAAFRALNIYNEPFSWIDTTEGGYCCGYNGADDAGKVLTELNSQQSFACLTDNKDFVSTEKDFDGNGIEEVFDNNGCEGKNWCWIDAAAVNNIFKIFTIKKPGEAPFDVVSNADDWLACNAQSEKNFEPPVLAEGAEQKLSNRFYCYQEGNRWAWAECTSDWNKRENPSVKGRYTGEGLYTLPLSIPEIPDEPTAENDYLRESKIDTSVVIEYNELYEKYYGQGFLDFTGYNYLNFMVRFVKDEAGTPAELKDLKLPLKINLKLVGPKVDDKKVVYFDGNVLGYAINSPLSDSTAYMHVQVPVGDYKAIQGFTISSDSENLIEVRNIYLTSDNPNLPNQLCSGQEAASSSTWIQDADAGNPDAGITGQNLCEVLYGKEAWLGEDQEVSEIAPAANCCGNAKNEYYAGLSKEFVDPDQGSEATYYGCWNSQPIASSDTVMDVEFKVQSQETEFDPHYDSIPLPTITIDYRTYSQQKISDPKDDILDEKTIKCNEDNVENTLKVGDTSTVLCHFKLAESISNQSYRGITKLWFKDTTSDDPNSAIELFFYDEATNTPIGKELPSATDPDDENFKLAGPAQYLNKEEAREVWHHPISVVAKLKPKHFFPISNLAPSTKPVTQTVTYACSETECLFPLPGNPPYKVTNLHPDLYELYYVTGTLTADETLITSQEFSEYANLRVKRIAQQVLYYNEGEESTKDIGFYGCRAADFITTIEEDKNLQYCAVIGDKFCSYSEVHKEEKNKDAFTVVNTWSEEGLTHVGYADPLQKPEPGQNISTYYENVELVLKEQAKLASSRNQSTAVLPAQNFIPNAEFIASATKIPYWEILLANGQTVADEKSNYVKENKVSLGSNQKLRSERISVPSQADLYFSTAQECITKILLVGKDGNSEEATLPQFNTGDASYLVVEFTGPCEVEKPSLQLVDEFGPVEYSYKSGDQLPEGFANPDARSGVACCPDNYCWNGYACVEPMSTLTTITEHVADGRDYRCVDGAWKRSPLKFDWNAQQWGFCPQESQCFVLGSGKAENTAESFYKGKYPICVNNTEYIFDNYCNQGNWTSRTKYLATKLLEVAENDEYTLYCSPYRETLLDLGNNENYLGGEYSVTQKSQQSLSKSLQKPAQPQVLPTCFNNIKDPDGKRLVPDSQNTCINNVCVLQYKDGGKFKVALATTLNKEIDDPKSFLVSLNIPQDKLSQICKSSGSDFVECNLQGLEFPSSADLYHSDELNAVIFAQEGLQLSPGVIDNILKWFKNLFGSGPLAEKTFVTQAQNFRNVYIANVAGKKVRAVEEIFPGVRQSLVAEYQNFDTPVCEYVRNIKVPPELQLELLEEASGMEKVHCAVNGTMQTVVVNAGLDFFWPQLTGKLRIGS
ncbi:hypothetical protein HY494_00410 [Candidatus Woesearchaeota archaeon]|nr:hypothetical protein [Candidatus Woesearchaeota archaeon]